MQLPAPIGPRRPAGVHAPLSDEGKRGNLGVNEKCVKRSPLVRDPKLTDLPFSSMVPPLLSSLLTSEIEFDVVRPRGVSQLSLSGWLMAGWLAVAAMCGCQLFSRGSSSDSSSTSKRSVLPPLRPAKDALVLHVLMVDRRADDPLLGPLLWQEIDQVGAIPTETRELLLRNGCLVGHTASKPPPPLLKLLGMVPEIEGADLEPKVTGRTYSILSGTETEVQTSETRPECVLTLFETDGERPLEFEQMRCVFRVRPVRLQDGWVRVEFLPEFHHGPMQMRNVPTELGWGMKSTQNIEACYPQRFSVTLNVGESVVVGAAPGSDGTLGDRFFRREQDGEARQRLLVVRLADMGRTAKPVD